MSEAPRTLPIMGEDEVGKRLVPVIVGGTFLSYTYVREFHRAYGTPRSIVIITQPIKMLTESRFTDCRIVPEAGEPEGLYAAMEKVAAELKAENPALVPIALGCDDRHALMFAAGKERLEACGYVVPCNDHALLEQITQKKVFYSICEELGIPYPKTWYFNCGAQAPEELPLDSFPYPCIAKPSDSTKFQNATVKGKRKIYEVDSPEELAQIWKTLVESDYDDELVIQDFIPGGDDAIKTLTTFSDGEGNMKVVAGGTVCLQDHNPAALGNPLVIMGERHDQVVESAQKFLKHCSYRCFANFDIKYDERDGSYKFFEVNTRCGRNTYYMSLGGVNFVELFVNEFVLGKPVQEVEAYQPYLYCCVPNYILKKSVSDKELLAKMLKLRKGTFEPYPLQYGKDSAAHNFWAYSMYFNQIRKFKRFYWDTNGKQYKG